ncbi:hypothetical protein HUG15_19820 [Salicibibacter cibarius]|uniref:Uncharacterized protein n=1 Tax=Salicibibacter cibarius TaxID=2743000 RepID=A0A7T7CD41_9BACI|nr:hypothetical protein [Salicibibacter cibarius]QQK77609.1 hypothetical protein HUG15_19820 [Salicibibacter cibarius]
MGISIVVLIAFVLYIASQLLLIILPDHILQSAIPMEPLAVGGFVVLLMYMIKRNITFNRKQNGKKV